MNEVMQTILSRCSVRIFTGEAVSSESLNELVKAGMAAPSAVNTQPWEFVIITKRSLLEALKSGLSYAQMLESAGAAIVVCGVPEKKPPFSEKYWMVDCAAVTQNILLAAHSLELGAVWTAVYPDAAKVEFVQKALDIPKEIIPLCVIPVGIPAGEGQVIDKFDEQKVHHEQY